MEFHKKSTYKQTYFTITTNFFVQSVNGLLRAQQGNNIIVQYNITIIGALPAATFLSVSQSLASESGSNYTHVTL